MKYVRSKGIDTLVPVRAITKQELHLNRPQVSISCNPVDTLVRDDKFPGLERDSRGPLLLAKTLGVVTSENAHT